MALDEKKTLLLIGAGAILIGGALGYLTYSTKQEIEQRKQEITACRGKISAARSKISKIRALEDDVIVLRQNLKEYVKILPDEREVLDFLKDLSDIAEDIGIWTSTWTPHQGGKSKATFEPLAYQLRVEGTIWQLLQFINRVESKTRFMIVPQISISPGTSNKEDGNVDDVKHQATLLVQTYRYNPRKGVSEPTRITNEERRIEELQERIAIDRKEILPPTPYTFQGAQSRRDPFIDPRIPKASPDDVAAGFSIQEQREIFAGLRKRIGDVQASYERLLEATKVIERLELQDRIRTEIEAVRERIAEVEKENVFSYLPIRSKFQREAKQFEALRQRFASTKTNGEIDFTLSIKDLKVLLANMRKLLHSGDLEAVIEQHTKVRERLEATAKDPKRRRWVELISRLANKAQVAKEFRSKQIDITGVAITPAGAAAIINGNAVAEGELLEDNLVVHLVRKDSVEFIYKNVVIVKKR